VIGTANVPVVEVVELRIAYRVRRRLLPVIRDVSFTIGAGEAYGLVGESGCGKSTVAMALMRHLPANAVVQGGQIEFAGRDLLAFRERELRAIRGTQMAMVFQDPGSSLNPALRIGAQIAEMYEVHRGLSRVDADAAAAGMLEKVRIPDARAVLRRYAHELSGGQQQRVMIAMALALDPRLLVLDEPTTGLDATVEADVLDLLAGLRAEFDTSILFISHNLAIVARLCDRVGVLYAGRLIEEGAAHRLFGTPRHPYTLGLLRSVPRLGVGKHIRRLEPIRGSLPPLGSDPPGCVYAPRCSIARERCVVEPPPLYPVGPGHRSACHYHQDVPAIPPSDETAPIRRPQGPSETLLRVEHLVKTYRSGGTAVQAVADVSLEIRRGEVFGLVGESGSGKTTLARCIAGLVVPTGGDVKLAGTLLHAGKGEGRELRRQLQMIFQNPDSALNPQHSVRRILRRSLLLLAGMRSRDAQDARATELVDAVRLEPHHLNSRPGSLSGGQKQRVAIARSFAGRPSLVLCDEPVSALDVSVQAAILNLLTDLQSDEDVSYLFISHDLGVIRYLSDRIGVMYLGWLVDVGPAERVFAPPHHPYTEALISAIPSLDPASAPARVRLKGELPSPANPPSGCRFHTRCPRFLGDLCRTVEPPWQRDDQDHVYRCHIPPADLAALQTSPASVSTTAERPA
jgi:peptide/nickel transport system ATP-binding protein